MLRVLSVNDHFHHVIISCRAEGPRREILKLPPPPPPSVMLNIEKCSFTYYVVKHVKWEVVYPNSIDRNFNMNMMKLNGRWFPQIVDRDSGNLYPIYSCSDF